ncbi:hypothetical protein N7492_003824 [Penicillium capsulatum]|uniref:GPI anchored protein n=1 Tax=Penicillium capsulatum TaxID=69766 RepID=A0A9W9IKB4_9EURO|nr:hypothetical protein N7492_003824 [Penicillium capsulatum]KAJ6121592.1 hypothetical protein N7512_004057 [Penicillium capsulatum]
MRATILFASLSALALQGAVAQSSSEVNPAVQYLTQTDANGVVTGQPVAVTSQAAAVTSQPAVVTSQDPAASIPAGLSSPVVTPQRSSLTSVVRSSGTPSVSGSSSGKTTATPSASSTDSSSSSESSSKTGSASSSANASTSTGGAAMATAAPVGLGVVAGAAMAAFL